MVYSDTNWFKQALTILVIFLIVSGVFFWSLGINPLSSLKGLNFLGQVTNTSQQTNNVTVTPFLQEMIDHIDAHQATPNNGQAFERHQTVQGILQTLTSVAQ